MSFLNTTSFLWAALLIPIVVFYILKIRLRRMPVSTIMFWQQIFEQKQPRSLWQHLRHLLSLLIQLAMLMLLVLALAEPYLKSEARGARRVVLIVDNSASMNAQDAKPTRLAAAKQEGQRLIEALRFTDEMAIIAAGSEPQVRIGLTDHPSTLRDTLDAIPATDGTTRVRDAVELGRRLLADAKNPRIIVLTDGCFEGAADLAKSEGVEFRTVGDPKTANVGITRFQVRRSLADPIGYEILAEVVNQSDKPAECRLNIDLLEGGDATPVDVVPLKLEPGARWSQAFEKTSAEGGRLVARLDKADGLAADNVAYALLPRRENQPVTLVADRDNLFLRKVFEAIPLVRLAVTREMPKGQVAGVRVYHRNVPKILPPGPTLVIEPTAATDLWELGPPLANPIVTKQDKDSPLMAHVRLDNVTMPDARQLKFAAGAKVKVLASSLSGDPIYALVDRPEGKVLVMTVNLDQGDLPLQTAFPILMSNAMAEFAGSKGELRESIAAGGLTEVDVPGKAAGAPDWVFKAPDGQLREVPKTPKALLGPLDQVGIWSIVPRPDPKAAKDATAAKPALELAANLSSRAESDLRAPEALKAIRAGGGGAWGGRPIWYYLIFAAWSLFALEWFLYQRRWIS